MVSAGKDDDKYEGDYPQEDHYAGDSCYYVKRSALVHDKYSTIECDDAELHEAIANHRQELDGEFKLQVSQPLVHMMISLLRTFPTSDEIGRT